ncbi:hypothetical protein NQ318_005008 [Aromia moschata]|uniref:Uncharacterized protein n=1 Tax=Aromia moschata TaxID=1265417 RepID=A0AAV8Y959_9CUCU|nr:hypothetical protein NQ318_005008 [Aromia moschata]
MFDYDINVECLLNTSKRVLTNSSSESKIGSGITFDVFLQPLKVIVNRHSWWCRLFGVVNPYFYPVSVIHELFLLVRIIPSIQKGDECISLVVVCWSPQYHNHQQQARKENVPISLLKPHVLPEGQAFYVVVNFYTVQHEEDRGDHRENQSVREVSVEG